MLHIGIVAGEASGDQLGAALIVALRDRFPDARITGMAGPKMRAAGCDAIARTEELSVMGVAEVLRNYPRLRRLRDHVFEYFRNARPDVFVGIDVPDFTLSIASRLHRQGIKTVHYVAPQIWAWRQSRAKKLARDVDLILTLFPFEETFFRRYGVAAKFVGHPVADALPLRRDEIGARRRLGLDNDTRFVALMPGSRRQEWLRHSDVFFETAKRISTERPNIVFLVSAINPSAQAHLQARGREICPNVPITVVQGSAHDLMSASDVALVVSGTVTMEGLFTKTPLVVAYKLYPLSYMILKRLVKVPYIAMPNVLAGEAIVPEFVQEAATPTALAQAVCDWFGDAIRIENYTAKCTELHETLRTGGANAAANEIAELVISADE